MMEELIQAAHKAFYERHPDWQIVPLDGHPRSHIVRAGLEHEIRAILQRARDPSKEMLAMLDKVPIDCETRCADPDDATRIWQTWIDAICGQR